MVMVLMITLVALLESYRFSCLGFRGFGVEVLGSDVGIICAFLFRV